MSNVSPVIKAFRSEELLALREDAYRLAMRVTGGTDAEDVVHDAYVRALQAARPPQDAKELRLWFLRIVVNSARTRGQQDQSRRVREQEVSMQAERAGAEIPNGAEQAARTELLAAVQTEIQALAERYRSALCLHYEQGLTYDEAAHVLDVPAGSLRAYASQGVRELRERLERRGHALPETSLCALLAAGLPLEVPASLTAAIERVLSQSASSGPGTGLVVTAQSGGAAVALKAALVLLVLAGGATWFAMRTPDAPPPAAVESQTVPVTETVAVTPAPAADRERITRRVEPPMAQQQPFVPLRERFANTPNWLDNVVPEEHVAAGVWKKVGGDIVCEPLTYSRLAVPYCPGEVYDIYLEFTREKGVADINVMLPFRGRTLIWKMGAQGNTQFLFKGVTTPDRVVTRKPAIQDGVLNGLLLEVRRDTVSASLNGELLLRENLTTNIAGEAAWNLPDQSAIGLGTWQAVVRFHRLNVETLEGTPRALVRDESIEQIAKDDYWKGARELLGRDVVPAKIPEGWTVNNGVATSDDTQFSRLDLGYAAPEEYDLRAEFVRNKGKSDVTILLARPGKSFCLKLGTWGNFAHALDMVHGRYSGNSPASVNGRIDNGRAYTVVVQVRKKSVRVFLDNRMLLVWPTDFSEFSIESNWAIQTGNIGIGSYEGSTTFRRVQIKELSAPPAKPAGAPAGEF